MLFDRVVVAIAENPGSKAPLFSTEERVAMAAMRLAELKNVEVTGYAGLTVDFAQRAWPACDYSRFACRIRLSSTSFSWPT